MRRTLSIVSLALVALLLAGAASASAAAPTPASGTFVADVDFMTITFEPRGNNCLLEVEGKLVFSGTLEGEAAGVTTALVFAPCEDVQAAPPGTYPDVFHSRLHFIGTVDGESAEADATYQGRSGEEGAIEAIIRLTNGLHGVLQVDAQLAVGGSYDGFVITR